MACKYKRPVFKSSSAADRVLAAIGLIHMIRKNQFAIGSAGAMPFANQFGVGRNSPSGMSGTVHF
jgi:hypothetical protein